MKHAPKKNNKRISIISALAIIVIGLVGFYFIGNASNNKHEKDSDSSSSVTTSHISSATRKSDSSAKSAKEQDSKSSASPNANQPSSQSKTPSQGLVYYNGQSQITLPMTDGTLQPQQGYPDGASFWPSTLTINGQQENVIASYSRQGYFAIYTKHPTNKPQGFTYNGVDFLNHIGDKNLDPLASSSKTVHYN